DEVAWSPEEMALFLGTIEDETDRLTGLVANLLDMSRLQVGALKLVRDVVGFDEVVPKALASLPDGGRGLVVEVPETLPRIDVDAEPQILRGLKTNLVARGYDVDTAPDGEAALDLAARRRPDVVIVDLGLPGIDGVDVIRGLRTWTAVPIIVLSAREQESEK